MQRNLSLFVLILLTLSLVLPSDAGDKQKKGGGKKKGEGIGAVKLGPEHQVLRSLVGVFDAKVKIYVDPSGKPAESTGVMTRKMILGGNFLQESFTGKVLGMPFSGIGTVGFDQNKKKFVSSWVDSMSTSIMAMTGDYDAVKKTIITVGEDFDPTGKKKMKARDVLVLVSHDEQRFTMYRQPEGSPTEFKVMEITFTRRAKKK